MRKAVIVALVCLIGTTATAKNRTVHKKARPIKDSYIVMIDDGFSADVTGIAHQLAGRHGGKVTAVWTDAVRGFAVQMSEEAAYAMANDPRIVAIEEDELAEITDWCHTYCYPTQINSGCADGTVGWQLDRIDKPTLGELDGKFKHCTSPGYFTRIYIVDSGIRKHKDFLDDYGYTRITSGTTFINDGRGTDDCYSHGTHVASFAAGRDSGAAKEAALVPVRVLDCSGNGSATNVINGINWVIQDHQPGPAVLNISLNFSTSTTMNTAVDNAVNDGIVVVVGAGNTGGNNCNSSPAGASRALTVGASTKTDARASFSSTGSCVDIFAPGEKVGGAHHADFNSYNCNPGWSGTSMAAPVVAGVAAVLYDALYYDNRNYYGPDALTQIIIDASVKNALSGIPTGTSNRLLQLPLGWGRCQENKCLEWCDPTR